MSRAADHRAPARAAGDHRAPARAAAALLVACALSVWGCSSGPATDASAPAPGSGPRAATADDGGPGDTREPERRAREQDIVAGLPLTRRVPWTIRSREGRDVFRFEGYFSGRELICVKAIPADEGDSSSVTTYVYDRGRLLGYTMEARHGATPNRHELIVHALLAPNGDVVAMEMTRDGVTTRPSRMRRQASMTVARRMASEAYEDMSKRGD